MTETKDLIVLSQAGDEEARRVLVEKNVGLIHHIVKRFLNRGYEMDDLFQIGSIGLLKAIDKFDLSYDVQFSTYAVPMITGEIKRFLRDDGLIKVSRSLKENGWKIHQAAEALRHELGREPTLSHIAEYTGLEQEDIVMAMEANEEVESIYKSVYQSDGNEIYLVDKLSSGPVGSSGGEDMEKEEVLNRMLLKQLLESLEEKERQLIVLRYYQGKTQVEVAKSMGITQVQVSRMEKRILIHMREKIL